MPLENIALTDIINATQITPGLGGWDAVINAFMANERGRQRYGLLSRVVGYGPGGPNPVNLIVLPSGWRCAVSQVMIVADEGIDPGSPFVEFGWESGNAPDNWTTGGAGSGTISIGDLQVASSEPLDCLFIHPFPGGNIFPPSIAAGFPMPAVPIGDGDNNAKRFFAMDIVSGSFSANVSISCFGMVWTKDDN